MRRTVAILGLLAAAACGGMGMADAQKSRTLTPAQCDALLRAAWKQEKIVPAPPVDDARFLRRATLDITGTIPTHDAVAAFLADKAPDKRARAVEKLLNSPRYAEHWMTYWDNVLMGRQVRSQVVDRLEFRRWLYTQFKQNTPWDKFVYSLVSASGQNSRGGNYRQQAMGLAMSPAQMEMESGEPPVAADPNASKINGAVNWILKYAQTPADLSGAASRVFLGVQLQCAQCHDHKTEKWKQDDFRAFTACFSTARPVPIDRGQVQGIRRVELMDANRPVFRRRNADAEARQYARAEPKALDGTDFTLADNRREALAAWMTAPENPWFAQAVVNRMWGHFLGRGFVDPVDDFRETNPAVLPELLRRLAEDFAARKYDLKHLIRTLCATEAYQRAAAPPKQGGPDSKLWARYRLKPLGPEVLIDSLVTATNITPLLERIAGNNLTAIKFGIQRQFTFLFDVDEESEQKEFEGTIPQALLLLNGTLLNGGASAIPGTALAEVLAMPGGDEAKIESLYLRTVSRRPTAAERKRWVAFVNAPREIVVTESPASQPPLRRNRLNRQQQGGRRGGGFDPLARVSGRLQAGAATPKQQAYEDLFWALLNSSEFLFNH